METRHLEILKNTRLAHDHYWLELANTFRQHVRPGQFVNISLSPALLLRRPFSVARITSRSLGILFKIRGRGTELLGQKKAGETLDVLGPLGTPFPLLPEWRTVWLVGGGTGIAPLLALAEEIIGKKKEAAIFYGSRTEKLLFPALVPKGKRLIFFATEDGTKGYQGKITGLVETEMRKARRPDAVFAGGPVEMLKEIAGMTGRFKIPAYVSMENRMACGTGVCLGCVTRVKENKGWKYQRVCKDGPVFPAEKIVWEE